MATRSLAPPDVDGKSTARDAQFTAFPSSAQLRLNGFSILHISRCEQIFQTLNRDRDIGEEQTEHPHPSATARLPEARSTRSGHDHQARLSCCWWGDPLELS